MALTKLLHQALESSQGTWLWRLIGEKRIEGSSAFIKKPGGAKGDLCFAKPNGVLLIIENKLKQARYQPRQHLLYLNQFLAAYTQNPGMRFTRHRLVILVPKGMKAKYSSILSLKKFDPMYLKQIKSKLTSAEIVSSKKTANWTKYTVSGTYSGRNRRINIRVKVIELDLGELQDMLKR